MRLRELIDALTRLETVCGPDTETEAMAVGLSIKTEVTFKNDSYSQSPTENRETANMITVCSIPLNRPDADVGFRLEERS